MGMWFIYIVFHKIWLCPSQLMKHKNGPQHCLFQCTNHSGGDNALLGIAPLPHPSHPTPGKATQISHKGQWSTKKYVTKKKGGGVQIKKRGRQTSGPPGFAATATIGQSLNWVVSRVFHSLFFICTSVETVLLWCHHTISLALVN